MKRFLTLFLAVLMVALSIPMMASADMTATEETNYTKYTVTGSKESNAETADGVKGDLYGTGDGIALSTKKGSGVTAKVWVAYDMSGVYFYFDVTDATQATKMWTANNTEDTSTYKTLTSTTMPFNDSVAVAINPTSTIYGDYTNVSGVGVAWAGRPGNGATTLNGNNDGITGCSFGSKNNANGYTAEIKIPYQGDFTYQNLENNGISFNVQAVDSGLSGDTQPTSYDAINVSMLNTNYDLANTKGIPSLWIYQYTDNANDCYKTYGNGYDLLAPEDLVVESIEVVSNPTKIFSVGESFVIGDTVVKAHYTNGYSEIIPNTDVGVTPYIFTWDDAGATVDVEIFYAGELAVASGTAATNAVATVAEKKLESVEADLTNVDLVYTEGNIFDAAGLVVTAYFLGKGETVAVPSEVTEGYTVTIGAVDGPDALTTELQLGDNVIYVNYGSLSTSFNITVEAKVLENIVVTKAPDKTVYAVGEYLDTTGMEVVAYYNNGDDELVSGYTVDVIGMVGGNESVGAEGKELELTDIFVQVNFGGKSARKPIIVTNGTSADALAYETIDPITVDGKKDGDNAYIGALTVGREGIDAAYGTAYFAYDADYLYVFVEVTDNTIVDTITGGGGATPATRNDSVIVGLNLAKANTKVTVYDANSITEQNKYSAWYSATRDKSLTSGYYGGHGHSNGGSYIVTREETANGYNVEMRIAWGVDFDAQAKMDAEDVSVWVAINDTTGGIVTSHPLSNTLLTTAGRWAYWHGSDDYQWNKLNAVEVAEISVDATNATVEFEVGDIFSSEGIVLRTEYEDGEFFNSSGFDCRSSIYLGRMFTRPGVFTIELLADDEVVGIYDITVTGDASVATGDDTLAFAPFAAAVAVIALAGVAILFNRKRRQA